VLPPRTIKQPNLSIYECEVKLSQKKWMQRR
jgi:hypothetical protein